MLENNWRQNKICFKKLSTQMSLLEKVIKLTKFSNFSKQRTYPDLSNIPLNFKNVKFNLRQYTSSMQSMNSSSFIKSFHDYNYNGPTSPKHLQTSPQQKTLQNYFIFWRHRQRNCAPTRCNTTSNELADYLAKDDFTYHIMRKKHVFSNL